MRLLTVLLVALLWLVPHGEAQARSSKAKPQFVTVDGERLRVNWSDGDSFRVIRGSRKGMKARLMGYNTLESYGPVHFWGGFDGYNLYDVAKEATAFVKTEEWECSTKGDQDHYGRVLVDCPGLSVAIIRAGLAHTFGVGAKADAKLVEAQLDSQNKRKGMWKWGIPARIVTSMHSGDEKPSDPDWRPYNRVCDTATGASWTVSHDRVFKVCEGWCHGGSCMMYVPFKQRYGDQRPSCLRRGHDNRMVLPPHLASPSAPR
jgi:micrococcal nuclease